MTGLVARYACVIAFNTVGPRTAVAHHSGSSTHSGSSSNILPFAVNRFTDLGVTIDSGLTKVEPGDAIGYLVETRNAGADLAAGTTLVFASIPELLSPSWTCIARGSAVCPNGGAGAGAIAATLELPPGSGLDFVQMGTVPQSSATSMMALVQISPDGLAPHFVHDPDPSNNNATEILPFARIFGDDFE